MAAKDAKVAAWKQEYLVPEGSHDFDYEVLHGTKCDPLVLKKALMALPALAQKRVVILRDCHKLSEHNQELLSEFGASNHDHLILICESSQWEPTHSFIKAFKLSAKIVDTGRAEKQNVFHMTKAISRRKGDEALKILSDLFFDGIHPLQIMGGLVWYWGSERPRMSANRFEKG